MRAPTPRSSRSGWCSSPRWDPSIPAIASASRPLVGLLSIGEEAGKGDTLRKEAFELLSAAPGIEFIGNVEGRDIMTDGVDVVGHRWVHRQRRAEDARGWRRRRSNGLLDDVFAIDAKTPHADALLPVPARRSTARSTLIPTAVPILLGVDGVCVISHGSASATAIFNAINVAQEMVEHEMVDEIRAAIAPSYHPNVRLSRLDALGSPPCLVRPATPPRAGRDLRDRA